MIALFNKLLDWFKALFWKEEMELTLVGLQYSGKTTFVNVIAVRGRRVRGPRERAAGRACPRPRRALLSRGRRLAWPGTAGRRAGEELAPSAWGLVRPVPWGTGAARDLLSHPGRYCMAGGRGKGTNRQGRCHGAGGTVGLSRQEGPAAG